MKKYTRLLAGLTAAGLGLSTVISASAAVRCGQALQFFDEQTQSDQTQAKLLSQSIEEMLSAGNYTDGEAIAVVRGSSGPAISGDAEMLLSLGSDSIRGAIDTEKKNGSPAADLAGQRMKEEGTPFSVWKVSDSGKTTKELLEELYADPDVISAEPNYMAYAAEERVQRMRKQSRRRKCRPSLTSVRCSGIWRILQASIQRRCRRQGVTASGFPGGKKDAGM